MYKNNFGVNSHEIAGFQILVFGYILISYNMGP